MELTINGKTVTLEGPITIGAFLQLRGFNAKMIVVEHNGEIVRRELFGEVWLRAGDVVEIVQMMAGG